MSSIRLNTASGGSISITAPNTANTYTIALPTSNGTFVFGDSEQTLTNKIIDGADNSISNVSLSTGVTGTLPVVNGGTGVTSPGTSGNVLTSNGTTWESISLPASGVKTWNAFTSSNTYVVPEGVESIRAYAFGAGGNGGVRVTGRGVPGGGGGGGCAFGDIAVTPGQNVTITISSGIATVNIGGTIYLAANPGNIGSSNSGDTGGSGGSGGTASKDASVTNGGAYSGGNGGRGGNGTSTRTGGGAGGGSAGSPLGNGGGGGWGSNGNSENSGRNGGGGGIGGGGGSGITPTEFVSAKVGCPGGAGGGGGLKGEFTSALAGSGGAGGPGGDGIPGKGRNFSQRFADPLLAHAIFPAMSEISNERFGSGLPGAGQLGAEGGDFAGGSPGGILGGGNAGFAGGFAGGGGTTINDSGLGGGAIVLIYA